MTYDDLILSCKFGIDYNNKETNDILLNEWQKGYTDACQTMIKIINEMKERENKKK